MVRLVFVQKRRMSCDEWTIFAIQLMNIFKQIPYIICYLLRNDDYTLVK